MNSKSPISITSTGFDPHSGLYLKDPYLEGTPPTLGACRPDLRSQLEPGEWNFTISGKIPILKQYIMGGFQVSELITIEEAYRRFPHLRLHKRADGQMTGNIVVDANGEQHPLDHHKTETFQKRILSPYVVGTNPIVLTHSDEIGRARTETMGILNELFGINGRIPKDILGRGGRKMNDDQVRQLLHRLRAIKINRVVIAVRSARTSPPQEREQTRAVGGGRH